MVGTHSASLSFLREEDTAELNLSRLGRTPDSARDSFHEKAGHSQGGFVFTYRESLPLSQAASDAILPSALLVER